MIALDAVLQVRENMKKGQRPDFQDYETAMAKRDRKMTRTLLGAYESLHKSMGYDGNPNYIIVQESLRQAQYLLDWCNRHYQELK